MGLREIKKNRARDALVKSAGELFVKRGFDGTTIEAIAEKAELAVGTFYNYFDSKSAVLLAITEKDFTGIIEDSPKIPSSIPAVEGAGIFLESVLDVLTVYPRNLIRELMREVWQRRNAKLRNGMVDQDLTLVSSIRRILKEMQKDGRIRDDIHAQDLSMVLYGCLMTAIMWYSADETRTLEEVGASMRAMLKVVFTGLSPEGGTE